MIKSKLTRKGQTTIPQPVRDALRLRAGDEIPYEIEGDRVILARACSGSIDDPFANVQRVGQRGRPKGVWRALGRGTSFGYPSPIPTAIPGSTARRW